MKRSTIITVVIVLLIVGGAAFALTRNSKDAGKSSSQTSTSESTTKTENNQTASTPAGKVTISYTDSGFSPADATAKSGDTVTITNNSSHQLKLSSDPHPAHTDDTDLNASTIEPGASTTITVTKTGSFGYHNHLMQEDKGHITIQ